MPQMVIGPWIAAAIVAAASIVFGGRKNRIVRTATKSNSNDKISTTMTSALEIAKSLQPPQVTATTNGEIEGEGFWNEHAEMLQQAWNEFHVLQQQEQQHQEQQQEQDASQTLLLNLDEIVDPKLYNLIQQAWNTSNDMKDKNKNKNDSNSISLQALEESIQQSWSEPIPGVYQYDQFLTQNGIKQIRKQLETIQTISIPKRRPNGMNRYGIIIDDNLETHGAVSYPPLLEFKTTLVNEIIRPLGRLFFPSFITQDDDVESYAFTIQYARQDGDLELAEHSDASVVTLNVNLNFNHELDLTKPSIYFINNDNENKDKNDNTNNDSLQKHTTTNNNNNDITFQSGMAVLHRGLHRHGAYNIVSSHNDHNDDQKENNNATTLRINMVIWLFGKYGVVRFAPYETNEELSPIQRWTKPSYQQTSRLQKNDNDKNIFS